MLYACFEKSFIYCQKWDKTECEGEIDVYSFAVTLPVRMGNESTAEKGRMKCGQFRFHSSTSEMFYLMSYLRK